MKETTFPRLLQKHARQRPRDAAVREKEFGIWQTWSWQDALEDVRNMALGLDALGFQAGENLAILGDNRPQLYLMFIAVQVLRGVPVPMYQDAVTDEVGFVLRDADVRFAFAEDQEQLDKFLDLRTRPEGEGVPGLEHIFYNDPRGLRNYSQPGLRSIDDLMALGRERAASMPGRFDELVEAGDPDDVAIILYTSGTTSRPKGVCQTHRTFIASAMGAIEVDKLGKDDEILSYLPPAWMGDYFFSVAQWLVAGFTINCPESADTVTIDMGEIGPTFYFAPPRVFEGMLTAVSIRMEDASRFKQWLYERFMAIAGRVGADILDGKPVSLADRLLYRLGDLLIYAPLKNALGLSRIRAAYTAGAAIGPDLFRFFRSIGVNLKQLYGQTETCAYVCLQRDGEVDLTTVGRAAPGIEIKIADSGEILVKGVSVLKEYYKRPEDTAEAIDENGYFRTGDAGVIDSNGQLRIIDRAKDVGRLLGGAMFAPNYIENKLKFFPQIKEAVCFGHDREEVCAFINIDLEAVGNWAERQSLPYAGYVDLAGKPQVLEMIRECVEQVNADLAAEEGMHETQIRRFLVLHKELDPDDDELTRTRKVRRGFIADKYGALIDALYEGRSEQFIETAVKFEDGRTGTVSATLKILEAKVFPPVRSAA
ncbi:MAG TPA: AMP-binding protein [Burkholderiaceae bacterium]|nr:AMP-binding protein [Burkholderiaceae bacterium]